MAQNLKSELSGTAKNTTATEARKQRIAEIRRQLEEGTYELSSDKLATAILDTMLERDVKKRHAA